VKVRISIISTYCGAYRAEQAERDFILVCAISAYNFDNLKERTSQGAQVPFGYTSTGSLKKSLTVACSGSGTDNSFSDPDPESFYVVHFPVTGVRKQPASRGDGNDHQIIIRFTPSLNPTHYTDLSS